MTVSDEGLAASAKAGDRAAFEKLVRRHNNAVYGICRRYLGDADDAYDVLQNAFAAAWMGLSRYDPSRAFRPWLRTIAMNKCRDFGRRRAVRRLLLSALKREPVEENAPSDFNADADDAGRRLDRLDREIALLPSSYKEVLILTALNGLSHQEAADDLRISAKAVEMRVYRAKQQLAKRLKRS